MPCLVGLEFTSKSHHLCGGSVHTDPRLLGAGDDDLDIPSCGYTVENSPMYRCLVIFTKILGQMPVPSVDVRRLRAGRSIVVLPRANGSELRRKSWPNASLEEGMLTVRTTRSFLLGSGAMREVSERSGKRRRDIKISLVCT